MTKKELTMIDNYDSSNEYTIWDVYARPSYTKEKIYCDLRNEMLSKEGYGFKICTHNSNFFTCGYLYEEDNKVWLVYHTPSYKYVILYADNI